MKKKLFAKYKAKVVAEFGAQILKIEFHSVKQASLQIGSAWI